MKIVFKKHNKEWWLAFAAGFTAMSLLLRRKNK